MSKVSFLISALACMLFIAGNAHAVTYITDCYQTLDAGLNVLLNDINDTSGSPDNCFVIDTNYVTLDCNKHEINGLGTSGSDAVSIAPSIVSAVIRNCTISNFAYGIFALNIQGAVIENNAFISNSPYGIIIGSGGILSNARIINNIFTNMPSGSALLFALDAGNITVADNIFDANVEYGVNFQYTSTSYGNHIYNNIFYGGIPSVYFGIETTNAWNITAQNGTRIFGNGTRTGGNYWGDNCEDTNNDGFCDFPKVLDANNTDYLPLSLNYSLVVFPAINQTVTLPPISEMVLQMQTYQCSGGSLDIISVYGYCTNSTCNTTEITASGNCQYGCDDSTVPNACNPSPSQAGMFVFIIIMILIAIAGIVYRFR